MKINSSACALQLPLGKTQKFLFAEKSNSVENSDPELQTLRKIGVLKKKKSSEIILLGSFKAVWVLSFSKRDQLLSFF